MAFGIDLGTTYSAVAMMKDGRPELIPNSLGEVLTPSVVAFDERGVPMVGKPAREYAVLHPARAAAVFKRHMGSEWTVKLGGRERSATELSAILLSHLRQEAEQRIGKSIEKVVITVPAYFNDAQRNATIEAGEAAGMEVQRVINEPTAAAIAYGLHEIDQERTAAIIDLGGGTFDVSIIEQYESVVEVKSSAGEIFLGGEDFTSALVFQLLQQQGHTLEIAEMRLPQQVARVRHICERLKRELTDQEQVTFRWPDEQGQADPDGKEVIVTRTQFNEWTEHILTRLTRPLRRAIGDAGVTPDEIDNVILVGGATRMPCVIQLTEKLFNQKAKYNLPPDSVVALGAAIQAGLIEKDGGLGELVVTDVAPFTLGIEISRKIGNQYRDGYFDPIIPRNTPLPTSRMSRVSTLAPNQTHIRVAIYQGESRRVEENLLLGELNIDGIPPGPPGQEVDVRFSYDLNGILEAEVTVVKTQAKRQLVISRLAKKQMSDAQIKDAVARMQDLKQNWRDRPDNRLLLNRAARIFPELSLDDREQLDQIMTAFEYALEEQNEASVSEIRNILQVFLSARDRELNWDGDPESQDD